MSIRLLELDLDRDDPLAETGAIARALLLASGKYGVSISLPLGELRNVVAGQVTREWANCRATFIAGLNHNAVAQARQIGGLTPSSYSYLNTVSAERRRNRVQAIAAFPFLGPLLNLREYDPVREAIDAGAPLVEALAKQYSAPKSLIRAMAGTRPEQLWPFASQPGMAVRLLREIPPDWWPRNGPAWVRFGEAADVIAKVSRHPNTTATNLLWLRHAARNGFQVEQAAPDELTRLGESIDEFMNLLRLG
jgi:hypothetical protein